MRALTDDEWQAWAGELHPAEAAIINAALAAGEHRSTTAIERA